MSREDEVMELNETEAVHGWFELSYSNYLVLPRSLLQSMPDEWQRRFVGCLRELDEAFEHLDQPEGYQVEAGSWVYVSEASEEQLTAAGVTVSEDDERRPYYWNESGDEMHEVERIFVKGTDPVPPYNRGRTHVDRKDELNG
jgi:hypothetical protein